MGRILAFDYGKKRVGIAVTDPLKIIATGLDTIAVKDIISFVNTYLLKEEVERFVVGMAVDLKNRPTDSTAEIKGFVRKLRKQFADIPVDLVDERFTSKIASETMIRAGAGKKARAVKATKDKIAATLILQSWMERNTGL